LIKAVLFDMGGVVSNITDEIRYNGLLKLSKLNLKDIRKRVKPIEHKFDIGSISANSFFRMVAENIGLDGYGKIKELYVDTINKSKLNKEVVRIVKLLKRKGYKVGILSNTNIVDATAHENKGEYDLFYPLILSFKVGCRKPGKKIYQIALKKLKVKPEECIFVDDKKRKLPPKSLGIKTILFKNPKQLKNDLKKLKIL
jgi:epoxide hydrolase-like predicted phosphatase